MEKENRNFTGDTQAFNISEKLSKRINSLRFLLIVFVVVIHNGISEKSFSERNINIVIPGYVKDVQTLIGIITAIAVPLFFLISGYLLFARETAFIPVIKKKIRSILLPYILWNALLVCFYFLMQTLPFTKQFFMTDAGHLIKNYSALDWLDVFAGKFTEAREYQYPFVYQFWFLRDLFILNLLFVPVKRLVNELPLETIVLFTALWLNDINIYIVSPAALLFFTLGCYIVKYNLTEKNIDSVRLSGLTAIYLITIIMEFRFAGTKPVLRKISIITGCIYFLKISCCFVQNAKIYGTLARLTKYTFIVYAVHGIIISQFLKIYIRAISVFNLNHGVFILTGYFLMILAGVSVSLLTGMIFKSLLPGPYGVLTGGR